LQCKGKAKALAVVVVGPVFVSFLCCVHQLCYCPSSMSRPLSLCKLAEVAATLHHRATCGYLLTISD